MAHKELFMKYNDAIFTFPTHLPNDLEGFMYFYPKKFPALIEYYETKAREFFLDPEGFAAFVTECLSDIYPRFESIKQTYEQTNKKDVRFLLEIDEQLQKLYAFRFWVINYLFADGPLHEFYVNQVRACIPKLIDHSLETEQYEYALAQAERNLLQSEHSDLYLLNALKSVDLITQLQTDKLGQKVYGEIQEMLAAKKNATTASTHMDSLVDRIMSPEDDWSRTVAGYMSLQIEQALFRKTREPIYQMLIQAVEFENENRTLKERQAGLTDEVAELLKKAKNNLPDDEYDVFYKSYLMTSHLAEAKDQMGNVDPIILPFWFDLLDEIGNTIPNYTKTLVGPGAVFYEFVWHVDDADKAFIYTPDETEL
jgi:hypothetical protein